MNDQNTGCAHGLTCGSSCACRTEQQTGGGVSGSTEPQQQLLAQQRRMIESGLERAHALRVLTLQHQHEQCYGRIISMTIAAVAAIASLTLTSLFGR